MKIANSLITSLACLKRHFAFREVFNNIDIFVRDLSPQNIPYGDKSAELLYAIIATAGSVTLQEGKLVTEAGQSYALKHNEASIFDHAALQGYTLQEKIRIVALYELVGRAVECGQIGNSEINSLSEGDVLLTAGQSLTAVGKLGDGELVCRLIRVDSSAQQGCRVGDMVLKAGAVAYGLFSKAGLYKVLAPMCNNSAYLMRLTEGRGGVELRITDICQGQEQVVRDVCSFCTIGDDNYLYIANNQVYSHHGRDLGQLLKTKIGILDIPMAVEVVGDMVVITMQDGSELKINYNR